ncbi:MAG: low temperature requirement protein A [Pseudomonadota bacterium]
MGGAVITFALWALYFSDDGHLDTAGFWPVFSWSYGHFLVFAAVAGIGTGLGVSIDALATPTHSDATAPHDYLAITIPVGSAVFGLWLVRDRAYLAGGRDLALVGLAIVIGVSGAGPLAPFTTCLFLLAALAWRQRWGRSAVSAPAANR